MRILISQAGCTSLSGTERATLSQLRGQGITVDRSVGNHEKPFNVGLAGALNILPGVGNFYLGCGEYGESSQWLFGFLNLLSWPLSIIWGIPGASIDADTLNKKALVSYCLYDRTGKQECTEYLR